MITFKEYQIEAKKTMNANCYNPSYLALGLNGEAGEVADKIKRAIRGDAPLTIEIMQELGDTLWYLTMLADWYCFSLEEIAEMNIAKLKDRQERGVLKGIGDER